MTNLVSAERASAASMIRPSEHAGLEKGAINDQLAAALKQIEQADLALRPVKLIDLFEGHPRHPAALGGQPVTRAGKCLLLGEHLLARRFPLLRRNDRWYFHCEIFSFALSSV